MAAQAGLAAAGLSRRLGKGEGSVIGGRVTMTLDPGSLQRLSAGRTVALVSGTNGKTTTTSLLVAAMETSGQVVTNVSGANMFGGMVGALSSSKAGLAVLEVDESHLPRAIELVRPKFVVLLNLSRDQLDRYGEVRMQAQKWRDALGDSNAVVVANADDPIVCWAASATRSVVWVGAGSGWTLDASSCPACGSPIEWSRDAWSCTSCEFARPEAHAMVGSTSSVRKATDVVMPLELRLPGDVNRRNAAMALTAAVLMGARPERAAAAVARSVGPGGRFASVQIGGARVRLVLAKNPAGWCEALRIIRSESPAVIAAINARVQDGRDPSWLWDVPYEELQGRLVVATGDRGRDLAVRLRYAEVDYVFEADLTRSIAIACDSAHGEEVDILANYSAFQDFRRIAS